MHLSKDKRCLLWSSRGGGTLGWPSHTTNPCKTDWQMPMDCSGCQPKATGGGQLERAWRFRFAGTTSACQGQQLIARNNSVCHGAGGLIVQDDSQRYAAGPLDAVHRFR
jgi:hypothetical protein